MIVTDIFVPVPFFSREVFVYPENGDTMLYRKFPRVPHEVSIPGFGCMWLPTEAGQQAGTQGLQYAAEIGPGDFGNISDFSLS